MEIWEVFFSEWRTFDAVDVRVKAAAAASGGIATFEIAGKSLEERGMSPVRFTGAGYQAGAPKVVLTFDLHADVWFTDMAGAYAVETLGRWRRPIHQIAQDGVRGVWAKPCQRRFGNAFLFETCVAGGF